MRRFAVLFALIVMCCAKLIQVVSAQEALDPWLYYRVLNADGSQEVTFIEAASEVTLHIPADQCYAVGIYHDLAAFWSKASPTLIEIRQLYGAELITSIPWKSQWGEANCQIGIGTWQGQVVLSINNRVKGNWIEYLNPLTGETIVAYDLLTDEGRESYEAVSPRLEGYGLPDDFLPDRVLRSPANPQVVIAVHCSGTFPKPESTTRGYRCLSNDQVVVYDLPSQTEIVVLNDGANGDGGQYYPATFRGEYSWSPDGRYIAYATLPSEIGESINLVTIFDFVTLDYVDTSVLKDHNVFVRTGIRWNPHDPQKVAFIVSNGNEIEEIRIFDVSTHESLVINIPGNRDGLEWSPDGEHFIVWMDDDRVFKMNLDGQLIMLAENAMDLRTNYGSR